MKTRPLTQINVRSDRDYPNPPGWQFLVIGVCIAGLIGIGLTLWTIHHPHPVGSESSVEVGK